VKKTALITLLGCVLLLPLARTLAQAENVVVGVNLVNQPDQLAPQEQDTILDNMKKRGSSRHPHRHSQQ
jgi:hypothetical protein